MQFQNCFNYGENHRAGRRPNKAMNPAPLPPEANEKAVRDIPREPEIVDLFKKIIGAGPLPVR